MAGLPIILSGNIPGQEEGNIPYVIDNQVGRAEKYPMILELPNYLLHGLCKTKLHQLSQRLFAAAKHHMR